MLLCHETIIVVTIVINGDIAAIIVIIAIIIVVIVITSAESYKVHNPSFKFKSTGTSEHLDLKLFVCFLSNNMTNH